MSIGTLRRVLSPPFHDTLLHVKRKPDSPTKRRAPRAQSTRSPRAKAFNDDALRPKVLTTRSAAPGDLERRAIASASGDLTVLPFEVDELPPRKQRKGKVGQTANDILIADRQAWVARLRRQRYTIEEIGSILDISIATVHKDIQAILLAWREASENEVLEYVDDETGRLEEVEREAWRGFHRSTRDVVEFREKTGKVVFAVDEDGESAPTREVETTRVIKPEPAGDPRFLATIIKCVELRARLRGLLTKENVEDVPLGPDGKPLPLDVNVTYTRTPFKREIESPPND